MKGGGFARRINLIVSTVAYNRYDIYGIGNKCSLKGRVMKERRGSNA